MSFDGDSLFGVGALPLDTWFDDDGLGTPLAFPHTLAWSGYWRANYAGAPWAGETTAGTSAGRALDDAADPPTGTVQNGWTPAGFNGGALLVAAGAIDDYIGVGTPFEFAFVAKLTRPSIGSYPDSTPVYDCPQIFGDLGGNIGCAVSNGGLRFWQYDNVGTIISTAVVSPGDWSQHHTLQGGWDGSNLWLSIDGGTSATAATTTQNTLSGLRLGVNYDDTDYLQGDVLEVGFFLSPQSAPDRASYRSYAQTRYALAGPITGTGSATIAPSTSGTGVVRVAGSGSGTIAPATSGTAAVRVAGTGSGTITPSTSGTGALRVAGSGSGQIDPSTSGSGVLPVVGTGAGTIAPSAAGSGVLRIVGLGAGQVDPSTSGSGSVAIVGSGSGAVAPSTSGTAGVRIAGSGSGQVTPTSSGTGALRVAGVGSGTIAPATSATGVLPIVGSGSATVAPSTTGSVVLPISGSGSGQVDPSTSGTGTLTALGGITGSGSATITATSSGTGSVRVAGTGSGTIAPTTSGTGALRVAGSGTGTVTPTSSATGRLDVAGAGSGVVSPSTSGAGSVALVASGAGQVDPSTTGMVAVRIEGTGSGSVDASSSGTATITDTLVVLEVVASAALVGTVAELVGRGEADLVVALEPSTTGEVRALAGLRAA